MKIAESIGDEHLNSDQKEIVRLINVKKQHGERIKGVSAGLWNFTKDTASGLWDVLMTPPEQVLWDLGKAVINYEETYAQISAAIASSYERDVINGTGYTRARWVTYAIATTATSVVGLKGADKAGKAGIAAGKNAVRETKTVVSNKINSISGYRFFPDRLAYVEAYDGGPYNVVDTVALKEKLETQGYMFFKGTYKTVEPVSNMNEFFDMDFGKLIVNSLSKSKVKYDGQSIYKVEKKTDNPYLKKGYGIYLDALHKDHLEVIDKTGNVKYVLNLDGTLNPDKTKKALGRVVKGWK
ncbi:hypothetical protein MHB63_05810 [Bacillus sp. FSL H8-0547]